MPQVLSHLQAHWHACSELTCGSTCGKEGIIRCQIADQLLHYRDVQAETPSPCLEVSVAA